MAELRMPEAEVSLRLAIHPVTTARVQSDVSVALDGAQIKVGDARYFDIPRFLVELGWHAENGAVRWQSRYASDGYSSGIVVHSRSGEGDVAATLSSGEPLLVEAKKGSLSKSRTSSEYHLLREALGQLLTRERFESV